MRWRVSVASLLLLAPPVVLAGGDDDDHAATPSPAGTGTVAATETATVPAEPEPTDPPEATPTQDPADDVVVMQEAAPTPLDSLEVVIVEGCYACEGGPSALLRVSAAGVTDLTASLTALGAITHYVVSDDGRNLSVGICTTGSCSTFVGPSPDAEVTFFRSSDGGASWEKVGTQPGAALPLARTGDGLLVVSYVAGEESGTYRYLPSGQEFVSPLVGLVTVLANGEFLWIDDDSASLLREDGSAHFRAPEGARLTGVTPHPTEAGRVVVTWAVQPPPPSGSADEESPTYFLALLEAGAEVLRYRVDDTELAVWAWFDDETVLGNVGGGSGFDLPAPALLDIAAGTISEIEGPFARTFEEAQQDPSLLAGRNFLVAGRDP